MCVKSGVCSLGPRQGRGSETMAGRVTSISSRQQSASYDSYTSTSKQLTSEGDNFNMSHRAAGMQSYFVPVWPISSAEWSIFCMTHAGLNMSPLCPQSQLCFVLIKCIVSERCSLWHFLPKVTWIECYDWLNTVIYNCYAGVRNSFKHVYFKLCEGGVRDR